MSGLTYADGVAVDSSANLYIADAASTGLLKYTLSAGTYSSNPTVIGSAVDPIAVALDGGGNLYATGELLTGGSLYEETLAAGTYSQTSASVAVPNGVAVDSGGNIYVAEGQNGQVVKGNAGEWRLHRDLHRHRA